MSYLELLRLASPEAIVAFTALLVLTLSLATRRAIRINPFLAVVGLVIAAITVAKLPPNVNFMSGMLVISPLNSLFKIVCLSLSALAVMLARDDATSLRNRGEYVALTLLATVGLMLLVGSEELLMIFIGLELTGLALYVLTAFDKTDSLSAEAGLKYFLFGSTASAFTLFGLSLIYGMSGTTALAAIGEKLAGAPVQPLLAVGIVMTLVGFAFKIAAAPFHLWAPDTYQGAPISSIVFIASASKVAAFVVLGKLLFIGFGALHGNAGWHALVAGWSPLLAVLAALSILLGNFAALVQTNVRRLLAYSAVAHAGYTLLGLVAGGREGFSATLFYTTIYAITLVGAFGVVGFVRRESGGDDLQTFAGLRARSPMLAGCMTVFILSLAGLPPFVGFFGKFYLFSVALRRGEQHGLLWLVVIALFGSLISLYYYLVILKTIFQETPQPDSASNKENFLSRGIVVTLAGAVLLLGVMPQGLITRILIALP